MGGAPEGASERARSIAEIFSQLTVRITDAPSWWRNSDNGMDLSDDKVVAEIYEAAIKAEQDEIARVQKTGEDAKKDLVATE